MFRKKKQSESELEERFKAIESQIESNASRISEFSKKLEGTAVELRTSITKEYKQSIEDVRAALEKLGIEINNQTLDLSNQVEKNSQSTKTWSLGINEKIEEFKKQYVDINEDLKKAKDLALEKEQIIKEKYEVLLTQLKDKENISLEKEQLSLQRIKTLQEELEKKSEELEQTKSQISILSKEVEDKSRVQTKVEDLEKEIERLKEDQEIRSYELERAQTQIKTLSEESTKQWGSNKALKIFLGESESGRVLNQLMGLDETNLDEIASLTGISTYNVSQIINRFKDMGIVVYDSGTRRVRLSE